MITVGWIFLLCRANHLLHNHTVISLTVNPTVSQSFVSQSLLCCHQYCLFVQDSLSIKQRLGAQC